MMRNWLTGVLFVLLGGCAPLLRSEIRLVEQAERGVELVSAAQAERAAMVEQLHEFRRQRLDEAFDADVRERADLDADWVIEHRRAYAAAADVLAESRFASETAERVVMQNLAAVREALQRLKMLQSAQLEFFSGNERGK